MITFSDAQIAAWVAAFLYPLARILGLIATAPLFNNAALPVRIRVALGVAIAFALAPALPPLPPIALASWVGLLVLVQQSLIGIALGFTMRIAFAAVDVAGDLIGLQMGLSFAVFYDPTSAAQISTIAELAGTLALLIFIGLNGHLVVLGLLAHSFTILPIGAEPFAGAGWGAIARSGATLFATGVLLALPLIAALLVANIALGILTRAAPQLNLFAVGFPITIVAGFTMLALLMPYFAPTLEHLFEQGFDAMRTVMAAGARQ